MKVQEKNRLILFGALLMMTGAAVAIVSTVVFGGALAASLEESIAEMLADPAYAAELAAAGLAADDALATMVGIIYALLGLGVAVNAVKIVVGALSLRRTDRASAFFLVWGAVFLVLGVLGVWFSGVATIFGMCDLAAGVFGPALLLAGGVQNHRAARRILAAEREAELAAAEEAVWPPVRKG